MTLRAFLTDTFRPSNTSLGYYGLIVLLSTLAGLFCYLVLPAWGFNRLANLLSIEKVWLLSALAIAAALYWHYIGAIKAKPAVLMGVYCLAIPVVAYINASLLVAGINFRWNQLSAILLWTPCWFFMVPAFKYAWKKVPYFRYFAAFTAIFMVYFMFYNAHAIVMHISPTAGGDNRTLDLDKAFNLFSLFFGQLTVAYAFYSASDKTALFDRINRLVAYVVIGYGTLAVITYPLNQMIEVVEGFKRSALIFTHPNQLGHYVGYLLLYVTGLRFYYQRQPRVSTRLLTVAIAMGTLCLLLSLSKSAFAATGIAMTLLVLGNLMVISFDPGLFRLLLTGGITTLLAVVFIQLSGLMDIIGTIQARFADNTSFNWRVQVWESLLFDMHSPLALAFGHGLTSSNVKVFQLHYLNSIGQGDRLVVGIHNGYLDVLYDFGILGWTWLLGLLMTVKTATQKLWGPIRLTPPQRILWLTVICMVVYFVVGCYFDEILYSNIYPFWLMTSVVVLGGLHTDEPAQLQTLLPVTSKEYHEPA